MIPKEQMISQLEEQKFSRIEALKTVAELERLQIFNQLYAASQRPETVGSYFKKHRTKCQRKFKNQ